MTRRTLLAAAAGIAAMQPSFAADDALGDKKLTAPPNTRIPVAFPISDNVEVIDYAGPWEVFQQVLRPDDAENGRGFELFTVAESTQPVTASGGLRLIPQYTFENAPPAKVIVI